MSHRYTDEIKTIIEDVCRKELDDERTKSVFANKMQPFMYMRCFDMSKAIKDNIKRTECHKVCAGVVHGI